VRRLIVFGLLIIVFMVLLLSWSCEADRITASLGQEFVLPVGQTAVIDSIDLSIKFIEVYTDSRCPKGAECIWTGEALCRLLFTLAGSPAEMDLTQPGGDVAASDYFIMYRIDFKLEPYPEAGKPIAASDYKLVMTISQK